jgi:acyl carrier protein
MNAPTAEQILNHLSDLVRNFDGREFSGPIGRQTLFFGDLGMASIDAIVLAETIERDYGRKFPFNEFLAALGRQGARDVALGELVDFLHQHLHVQADTN